MKKADIHNALFEPLDPYYTESAIRDIVRALKEDVFDQGRSVDLDDVVRELIEDRPIQYITGLSHFYGQTFYVDDRVLVPRPETEELAHWIIKSHRDDDLRCLEHGTGSGCLGLTLAKQKPSWSFVIGDISADAADVARINAKRLDLDVKVKVMDMVDPKTYKARRDIIAANPPYVRYEDRDIMEATVLDYEPHVALFAPEGDALYFYRQLFQHTAKYQKDCWVYVEHHHELAEEVMTLMEELGYEDVICRTDLQGLDRMTRGHWVG